MALAPSLSLALGNPCIYARPSSPESQLSSPSSVRICWRQSHTKYAYGEQNTPFGRAKKPHPRLSQRRGATLHIEGKASPQTVTLQLVANITVTTFCSPARRILFGKAVFCRACAGMRR